MTALDADRAFALGQVPPNRRPAIGALWRLDAALGAVLAGGREPMISRIKLAWWRDSLEQLDLAPPPAEPVLQDVAALVLPCVPGHELAGMEEGWAVLLAEEGLTSPEFDRYGALRGGSLFSFSARLLGVPLTGPLEQAGEGWALADLARHSAKADAEAAFAAARERFQRRERWPAALRPLGMLAALARRDAERGLERLEPPGAPPRVARMLRHRLIGR